jgi:hypothetical protein
MLPFAIVEQFDVLENVCFGFPPACTMPRRWLHCPERARPNEAEKSKPLRCSENGSSGGTIQKPLTDRFLNKRELPVNCPPG